MDIIKPILKLALLGSQWVMVLLLVLSVFSIATMVERFFFFRAKEKDLDALGDALVGFADAGQFDEAKRFLDGRKTIEASIFARAIAWAKGGAEALSDAVDSEMAKRKVDLERGMNFLGTLGSNAPFVGLLGTVIGVIQAFNNLGAGQDKSAMASVMAGIAEALVATGVGLFVAIPAVVAYNVFQKQLSSIEDNVGAITKQLSALLKAGQNVGNVAASGETIRDSSNVPARVVPQDAGSSRELVS